MISRVIAHAHTLYTAHCHSGGGGGGLGLVSGQLPTANSVQLDMLATAIGNGHFRRWGMEAHEKKQGDTKVKISSEISPASASTVRAHFGCIFKATADCAT